MSAWLKRRLTGLCYGYLRSQRDWAHDKAPEVRHARVLPMASHAPWVNDTAFLKAHEAVRGHTLIDIMRLYELWTLARQLDHVDGDFLEVGVWRGGSGCLLAMASQRAGRGVFLADTFSGVVKAGQHDTRYTGGEHADTDVQRVLALARRCQVEDDVRVLVGMFPEHNASQVGGRLALLHIDVDVFESARDVLRWAAPRLVRGAVVVFDDYGFHGCEGVTRMVNAFMAEATGYRFVHNLNGHAILIKVADHGE
ncbi:TylF/MycF/NovP-related O-methyltransferase [Pseudomonas sp. NBRC 111119]|uniref:TylF/MycF/NovP-related O-methyltransferase n=1 Tax=Pseudomonas sp. NBRC 111119 TaxID=1661034 RepID=UPI000760DEA5|nr:TylF/MycF/NovP-related O-methyltransferase [Pseudomonas sp. NBRC 111119]